MAHHRIFCHGIELHPGAQALISGDEAQHALRVKRVEIGQTIEVLDGRGAVAEARLVASRKSRAGWEMVLDIASLRLAEPIRPALEVWTAVPKGDRLGEMVDQLSQVGAVAWAPLAASRSVVDPRPAKLERLRRTAVESAKQCGRAWVLEILSGGTLTEALEHPHALVADAGGRPFAPDPASPVPESLRLLIGPEGGWTDEERAAFRASPVCSFGRHVMRVETAAVVGAGIVLEALGRSGR